MIQIFLPIYLWFFFINLIDNFNIKVAFIIYRKLTFFEKLHVEINIDHFFLKSYLFY